MKKVVVSIFMASGILFFANCHPKMHKASSESKTTSEAPAAPKATPEQIAQGKTIYDSKCGSCHDLPKPADYTAKQWSKILPPMISKANLAADKGTLVEAYVKANMKTENAW